MSTRSAQRTARPSPDDEADGHALGGPTGVVGLRRAVSPAIGLRGRGHAVDHAAARDPAPVEGDPAVVLPLLREHEPAAVRDDGRAERVLRHGNPAHCSRLRAPSGCSVSSIASPRTVATESWTSSRSVRARRGTAGRRARASGGPAAARPRPGARAGRGRCGRRSRGPARPGRAARRSAPTAGRGPAERAPGPVRQRGARLPQLGQPALARAARPRPPRARCASGSGAGARRGTGPPARPRARSSSTRSPRRSGSRSRRRAAPRGWRRCARPGCGGPKSSVTRLPQTCVHERMFGIDSTASTH